MCLFASKCSWNGDWVCGCGNQYSVRANCRGCGIVAPCRYYDLQGPLVVIITFDTVNE